MMDKNKYANYAFKIGSVMGGIMFLLSLLTFYAVPNATWVSLLSWLLLVCGLSWAFVNYRRNILQTPKVKFGRLMAIGAIISLVIAFFVAVYELLHIHKLDVQFIQNIIDEVIKQLETMKIDASLYEDKRIYAIIQAGYPFSAFIGAFIRCIFWSLVVALVVSRTSSDLPQDNSKTEE